MALFVRGPGGTTRTGRRAPLTGASQGRSPTGLRSASGPDVGLTAASRPAVSLVIPAHNEEHRLPAALAAYATAFAERWPDAFEILVVSNGSHDGTVDVALAQTARLRCLRVLDIAEPVGKGGAIREGFRRAQGARVVFADADAATSPHSLVRLVDGLADHVLVIGSRRLPESRVIAPQSLARRVLSALFGLTVCALFGLPFRDTQCGAKALRRDAARVLAECVQESRWTFDVELLVRARDLGYSIHEAPVEWTDRPGSHLRLLPTLVDVCRSLVRIKLRAGRRDSLRPATVPVKAVPAERAEAAGSW